MSAATWSQVGKRWAQYLVDKGLVKSGDFVWMPVEVPGATYGVQEEEGIASVFKPMGITWEVTDNTLDQAEVITRMSDYLTANRGKIKAIIGLGDMVTGSIKRVFDQVGVAPGEIPVVGWGNSLDTTQEVLAGYVNAGMWQDPQATSYIGLSMAAMARCRHPAGLRRHHRRALREGHGPALRRHHVGQVAASARGRPARAPASLEGPAVIKSLVARPEFGPFVLLVLELVVFSAINPQFMSAGNIGNTLTFTVELGLIALPMTLLMTAGEFDLSVGSVFGFSAVVMWTLFNTGALPARAGVPGRPCWPARLHRLRQRLVRDQAEDPVVPGHARACCWWCAARRCSSPTASRSAPGAPRASRLAQILVGDFYIGSLRVYMSLFWFALAALVLGYVLTQTKAGNWIQASGGNPNAARARGVNVERTKIALFMLTSVMSALAGVISSIRTSAANPNSGTGYELEVIAMVVIGGTALMGGRGTIIGTVLGVFILRVMRNGIVLIGVPGLAYNIFIGAIILAMMALHSWLERRHQGGG